MTSITTSVRKRPTRWAVAAVLAGASATGGVVAVPTPASAAVPLATTVTCADGREFGATDLPSARAVVGLVVEGNTVGVATSIWLSDASAGHVYPVWARPGAGLAGITTWCTWASADSPTGWFGADLLLSGPKS